MNDYIYMLYRIKHHDSGIRSFDPFHAPIDAIFSYSYMLALRTLARIRKNYRERGYFVEFVKSPIYPEKVKTVTSFTYMCTYLVHPFPDKGMWYEYIILKCPIFKQESEIDAL